VAQLDCVYRVGRSLEIVIAGVGLPEAGITVVRADGYDRDYYATLGVSHGCVIVKPGTLTTKESERTGRLPGFAFISAATGNVYRTWEECGAATQSGQHQ